MGSECVTEITSCSAANDWALALISNIAASKNGKVRAGLDCEWNRDTNDITQTLQLSFPCCVRATSAVLFNLSKMEVWRPEMFPKHLKNLLQVQKIVPVGVQVGNDVQLLSDLGVQITPYIDLGEIAKQVQDDALTGFGL